jgi:hypothetical protein
MSRMNINYPSQSKNWNIDKTREEANRGAPRVSTDVRHKDKVEDDTRQTRTGTSRERDRYKIDDDTSRGRAR